MGKNVAYSNEGAMQGLKFFLIKHFEKILVLFILFIVVFVTYLAPYKIGFLNFFYLPIIIAGYYLGRRMAVLTALLCVLFVVLAVVLLPSFFFTSVTAKTYVIISLLAWSSFLVLTSAAIGYLYEEKEKKMKELKGAYIGILEILSKYLESADRYTQGHSVRVSHLAYDIAAAMNLTEREKENIKTAALLHDIGKTEISMDIVTKAAALTEEEKEMMEKHTEKGAEILSLVGDVLKDAVPLVLSHHKYYFEKQSASTEEKAQIPLGAEIIAVADAYDAMISDRPYRKGMPVWQAAEQIEKEAGKQFRPDVVNAFKNVLKTSPRFSKEEKESH
jgi:putative nucleotidyltransferase with HDIG domain